MKSNLIGAAICATAIGIGVANALPPQQSIPSCCTISEIGNVTQGNGCYKISCTGSGSLINTFYDCDSCNPGYVQNQMTFQCTSSSAVYTIRACTLDFSACAAGEYKDNGQCLPCPQQMLGATSAAGATAITQCYIPTGTGFFDTTGSGQYTADCYYSNISVKPTPGEKLEL